MATKIKNRKKATKITLGMGKGKGKGYRPIGAKHVNEKPLSWHILSTLHKSKKPLTQKAIWEKVSASGWRSQFGATPHLTCSTKVLQLSGLTTDSVHTEHPLAKRTADGFSITAYGRKVFLGD